MLDIATDLNNLNNPLVIMKALLSLGLLFNLATAKVSYNGYKAFRIDTHGTYEAVEDALANITYVSLSCENNRKTLEVAVSPDSLKDFQDLQLSTTVISEDLGVEIASEGELKPYKCRSKLHIFCKVITDEDSEYENPRHCCRIAGYFLFQRISFP